MFVPPPTVSVPPPTVFVPPSTTLVPPIISDLSDSQPGKKAKTVHTVEDEEDDEEEEIKGSISWRTTEDGVINGVDDEFYKFTGLALGEGVKAGGWLGLLPSKNKIHNVWKEHIKTKRNLKVSNVHLRNEEDKMVKFKMEAHYDKNKKKWFGICIPE